MNITKEIFEERRLPVGGEWIETGAVETIRLPYDGAPVAEVALGTPELVGQAVSAAGEAAGALAGWSNFQRAELLDRIAALLRQQAEEFATLIRLETGKPIREARGEVERSLQTLLASSIAARELHGEVVPLDGAPTGANRVAFTIREPLGVIGIITPFNVPLNLTLHKLGPALAGGNAVVHKPAEQTPLSALRLAGIVRNAGAPAGTYNVVTGPGETVGRSLVEATGVDMITFTGSIEVGREIRARAGLKKVTLELGGNSAVIVEPDSDLAGAIERVAQGGYAHSGQLCISVQRIYVHEDIAGPFRDALAARVAALRVGHPAEESSDISSLISVEAAERVESWTRQAVAAGGQLLTGGMRSRATIQPGVLAGVPESAQLMQEELFGPVVVVNTYRDLDDAIARVNGTRYGLQAGIYTPRIDRAFYAARKLRAGGVLINDIPTFRVDHMPYGGAKESGLGREGPRYAAEEMTERKLIAWRI